MNEENKVINAETIYNDNPREIENRRESGRPKIIKTDQIRRP